MLRSSVSIVCPFVCVLVMKQKIVSLLLKAQRNITFNVHDKCVIFNPTNRAIGTPGFNVRKKLDFKPNFIGLDFIYCFMFNLPLNLVKLLTNTLVWKICHSILKCLIEIIYQRFNFMTFIVGVSCIIIRELDIVQYFFES